MSSRSDETKDDPLREAVPFVVANTERAHADGPISEAIPSVRTERARAALDGVMSRSSGELFDPGPLIGEGGMARVKRAVQRSVGRDVAVKMLARERRSRDDDLQLMREAWLTATLEHPNIVPVYDVFVDPQDGPTIVLKHLQGVTWADVIDDGDVVRERFDGQDLFEFNAGILMQLCRAIHFAHSRGVVHRDIKPANVMIGDFGEVYLLDWGIALSLEEDPTGRLPVANEAAVSGGTPAYMAPEMLRPDLADVGPRSDVYLLGAVLYQIITGRAPHAHKLHGEIVASIEESRPKFDERVPRRLQEICARAMARQPEDRYGSADELRLELADYLRTRDSVAMYDNALSRYRDLEVTLDRAEASPQEIFAGFGACRVLLEEALREWPANEQARGLSSRLVHRLAEHHLGSGEPGAARALLAEHPSPDPELVERVEAAFVLLRQEREALAQLKEEMDPQVGRSTRRAAMVSMGVLWTLSPIAADYVDPESTPAVINYGMPSLLFVLAVGVWYAARDSLAKTAINRRFLVAMLSGFCAHMVGILLVHLAGLPVKSELAIGMVAFGAIMAVLAHTAERRMWPLVPLYWGGALLGAVYREQSPYILAGCNLVLTIAMLAIWSPASEARGDRDQAAAS